MELGERTYWNGERVSCRRVLVMVGYPPSDVPNHWARPLVGTPRNAVEVRARGSYRQGQPHPDAAEERFFIDDQDGEGWQKVTQGKGSPSWPHRNVPVRYVVEDRDAEVRLPTRDGVDVPQSH